MATKTRKREDLEKKFTWDLSAILSSEKEFDDILERTVKAGETLNCFEGKLSDRAELLKCLKLDSKVSQSFEKAYAYAAMKSDENTKNSNSQKLLERASNAYSKLRLKTAFIFPELAKLEDSYLLELEKDKDFADFSLTLKEIIRARAHTLSKSEEELLARGGEVFSSFSDIFKMLNNADIKFGEVKNENGEMVELTHSSYSALMSSEVRKVRKAAYEKMYKGFSNLIHTISATYIASVKKNVFLARSRKFQSAIDLALFNENVDRTVYDRLLQNVQKALPTLHEYIAFRKKKMGLKQLRFYDLYVSLFENSQMKCEYEKAYELVMAGLAPLKEKYQSLLKEAFSKGWIDVYPTDGKRSGAYSNSVYGVHPYVLLNYEKTTHDIFTIAHELGHAMHSYFSMENQCYEKADYTIFVAEVASTVNEVLLLRHLIENNKDKDVKKFCLNYFLDMLRTTLFRQSMFAEFEYIAHNLIENDVPVNYEVLSEQYEKLNAKYYGDKLEIDQFIKYEWARIPHFYRAFYVYKYATGIISAISIAYDILEKGETAVEKYMQFLKSGGSEKPTELLKIAGVDLTSDEPFKKAMQVFKDTLKELKELD